jgi:parallel beta-helix repeat protein
MFIRLPDGVDIKNAGAIEVAFASSQQINLLRLTAKNNVAIRNITFTHSNPGYLGSSVYLIGRNILVENCHFDWNDGRGISIKNCDTIKIINCTASHNGANGFRVGETKHLRVENSDVSFNNHKGSFNWDAGGLKAGKTYDSMFLRDTFIGNNSQAMWLDCWCERVVFENCFCYSNKGGIALELSTPQKGDYIVRNCVVATNKDGGFNVTNVARTKIVGNLIVNNGGCQIRLENQPRGGWATYGASDWVYLDIKNNILASNHGNLIGGPDKAWVANDVSSVFPILNASGNQYFQNDGAKSFKIDVDNYTDFAGWKQKLASVNAPGIQDANSIWKDPGLGASPEADFTPGSPIFELAQKTGTPIPANLIEECNSNKWNK